MTTFQSIAGGAVWALVSVLLVFAALEPVSVGTQVEIASAATGATAA
ncbi:MAG TPA: hypothetical protein VNT77_07665 [Allosphingosinicella sp.]|nr:hypothetical protein [Allosphingosinicella sp.]